MQMLSQAELRALYQKLLLQTLERYELLSGCSVNELCLVRDAQQRKIILFTDKPHPHENRIQERPRSVR